MNPTSENINKMKMCILCNENLEDYSAQKAALHLKFGLHSTKGNIWQPMKGHELYETHLRWCKLLGLSTGK